MQKFPTSSGCPGRIKEFKVGREMLAVQGESGHWDSDDYMHGLYNGMEFMLSLIEGREPDFRDAPARFRKDFDPKKHLFPDMYGTDKPKEDGDFKEINREFDWDGSKKGISL